MYYRERGYDASIVTTEAEWEKGSDFTVGDGIGGGTGSALVFPAGYSGPVLALGKTYSFY